MKCNKVIVSFVLCMVIFIKMANAVSLEKYTLGDIPVPKSFHKVTPKVDITENSIYPVINEFENNMLSHIDPLSFERNFTNTIPKYKYLQFITELDPKEVFNFYKSFYESLKGGKGYSEMHYSVLEGDPPSQCKNNEIVYYTIKINTSVGGNRYLYFSISAFKRNPDEKTEVYIFNYEKE